MRGFAILMVLLYHERALVGYYMRFPAAHPLVSFETLAKTGFMGVELFFFLSGFCLFYPYARSMLEGAPHPTVREFAYRRFIKIVPSYVLALSALTLIYHTDFKSWSEVVRHYLVHLFFLHPFWKETLYSISGPLWTLGIEVQFYLLFPLIALAFMRSPILAWLVLGLAAIFYRGWIVQSHVWAYTFWDDQLPGVIDLFATGMLGAYLYARWRPFFERSVRARVCATIAAIVAVFVGNLLLRGLMAQLVAEPPFGFYHWQVLHRAGVALDCLAFALASAFALTGWRLVVANPVLAWLSVISYNLYLWHDGIILYCHNHGFPCALQPFPWKTLPHWGEIYLATSLFYSLAIAILITYLLERPLLRLRPAWLRLEMTKSAPFNLPVQPQRR